MSAKELREWLADGLEVDGTHGPYFDHSAITVDKQNGSSQQSMNSSTAVQGHSL